MSGTLLGELVVRFQVDTSALARAKAEVASLGSAASSSMAQVGSSVKSAGGGFLDFASKATIATAGLIGLGAGAVSLAGAILAPNASMEQTEVAFTTLLKSGQAADAFLKELAQFAASTPFEFPELADASRKLLAFGFSAKEVIPLMTSVGDAVSALGGGAPEIDRVVFALGQMQAKGKASNEELLQLAELGIPVYDILSKSMGKSVAEVQDLVSKGLLPAGDAIDMLTKGMDKAFGGGMAAQSRTFNGILSTLKDNAMAAWRAFTGPLFEQAKSGLVVLADLAASPALQNFASVLGSLVGGALTAVGTSLQPVIAGLRQFGQFAYEALAPFQSDPFVSFLSGVGKLLTALSTLRMTLIQIGVTFVSGLLSPLKLTSSQVSAFFTTVLTRTGAFANMLAGKINQINATLAKVNVTPAVQAVQTKLSGLSTWITSQFVPQVQRAFAPLSAKINAMLASIDISASLGKLQSSLSGFSNWIKGQFVPQLQQAFEPLRRVFEPLAQLAQSQLVGMFSKINFGDIGASFNELGTILKEKIASVIADLQPKLLLLSFWFEFKIKPAIEKALPSFQKLGDVLMNTVAPALGRIGLKTLETLGNIAMKLAPVFMELIPLLITLAGILAGGLAEGLKAITPDLERAAGAVLSFGEAVVDRLAPKLTESLGDINGGLEELRKNWDKIWPVLAPIVEGAWNVIKGIVEIGWSIVSGIILIGLDLLTGDWEQAWEDLVKSAEGVWHGLVTLFTGLFQLTFGPFIENFRQILSGFGIEMDKLPQMAAEAWDTLQTEAEVAWNEIGESIANYVGNLLLNISNTFSEAWTTYIEKPLIELRDDFVNWAGNLALDALEWGKKFLQGFMDGIVSTIPGVATIASKVAEEIAKYLPHSPAEVGPLAKADQFAPSFMTMFTDGLLAGIPQVQQAMIRMMTSMRDMITVGFQQLGQISTTGMQNQLLVQMRGWQTILQMTTLSTKQIQQLIQLAWDAVAKFLVSKQITIQNALTTPFKNAASQIKSSMDQMKLSVSSAVDTMINDLQRLSAAKSSASTSSTSGLIPGHASGILNSPIGHFAVVGEQGPETMYVPKGASIFPNGYSFGGGGRSGTAMSIPTSSGGGGGGNHTFIFEMDGSTFARIVGRYMDEENRLKFPRTRD